MRVYKIRTAFGIYVALSAHAVACGSDDSSPAGASGGQHAGGAPSAGFAGGGSSGSGGAKAAGGLTSAGGVAGKTGAGGMTGNAQGGASAGQPGAGEPSTGGGAGITGAAGVAGQGGVGGAGGVNSQAGMAGAAGASDGCVASKSAIWTSYQMSEFVPPDSVTQFTVEFSSLWTLAANDVWLTLSTVQNGARLWHWDGSQWTKVLEQANKYYQSVWSSAPDDIWVATDTGVLRGNGTTWNEVIPAGDSGVYSNVWGYGPSDVWAFAGAGSFAVLHWNGQMWDSRPASYPNSGSPADLIYSPWSATPNTLWVAGDVKSTSPIAPLAFIGHWDGNQWNYATPAPGPGLGTSFHALQGTSEDNIWLVGSGPYIAHFDGASWSPVDLPSANGSLSSVWTSCAADAWAAGKRSGSASVPLLMHYDGSGWSSADQGLPASAMNTELNMISGANPDDFWIVGLQSTLASDAPILFHRHL